MEGSVCPRHTRSIYFCTTNQAFLYNLFVARSSQLASSLPMCCLNTSRFGNVERAHRAVVTKFAEEGRGFLLTRVCTLSAAPFSCTSCVAEKREQNRIQNHGEHGLASMRRFSWLKLLLFSCFVFPLKDRVVPVIPALDRCVHVGRRPLCSNEGYNTFVLVLSPHYFCVWHGRGHATQTNSSTSSFTRTNYRKHGNPPSRAESSAVPFSTALASSPSPTYPRSRSSCSASLSQSTPCPRAWADPSTWYRPRLAAP